jgi:hypothetical protein
MATRPAGSAPYRCCLASPGVRRWPDRGPGLEIATNRVEAVAVARLEITAGDREDSPGSKQVAQMYPQSAHRSPPSARIPSLDTPLQPVSGLMHDAPGACSGVHRDPPKDETAPLVTEWSRKLADGTGFAARLRARRSHRHPSSAYRFGPTWPEARQATAEIQRAGRRRRAAGGRGTWRRRELGAHALRSRASRRS